MDDQRDPHERLDITQTPFGKRIYLLNSSFKLDGPATLMNWARLVVCMCN